MQSGRFCPKCGKTSGLFIKGLCRQCFLQGRELLSLPEKVQLPYCSACGKATVQGRQVELQDALVKKSVKQKAGVRGLSDATVSVEFKDTEQDKMSAIVRAKGFVDSVPIMLEKELPVVLLPQQCDACMRLKSNYWEAKVQIRSPEKKKVQRAFSMLQGILTTLRKKDNLSAIAGVEEVKNGLDVLIGSSKVAAIAVKQLQREFQAETKKSFKLIGVDKTGREKKRFTLLLRL